MKSKLSSNVKVILAAFMAGGSLLTPIVTPAKVEASEMLNIDVEELARDSSFINTNNIIANNVLDSEVLVSRQASKSEDSSTQEELKSIVFTKEDAIATNSFNEGDAIIDVKLDKDIMLKSIEKVEFNNQQYYKAYIDHNDFAATVENYLEIKDMFKSNEDQTAFEVYVKADDLSGGYSYTDSEKRVFAITNAEIIKIDNGEVVEVIDEAKGVNIIGENKHWYILEGDTPGEKLVARKRLFVDHEFFVPDYQILEAKEIANLYTDQEASEFSGYHVEKGGKITQLERSERWAKIKLDDGTVLFADLSQFNTVEEAEETEEVEEATSNNEESTSVRYVREVQEDKPVKKKKVKKVKKVIPKKEIQSKVDAGSPIGNQVADFALQFVGGKYVWGGNSLENGVDCSGFVREVYKRFGVNLPRHSSQQGRSGRAVSYSEAKPGDVVHYNGHVAIYLGNGKVVHALNARRGIVVTGINHAGKFNSIRRIVE